MKSQTKTNLITIIDTLKANRGILPMNTLTTLSGVSSSVVYGAQGTWSRPVEGEAAVAAPLYNIVKQSGHVFVVLTTEGRDWDPNMAKTNGISEEDALAQLLQTYGVAA
jgi:hypothetical protein